MEIKEAIIQTIGEVIPMFGVVPVYKSEETSLHLTSGDQVNVLIGFSAALRGTLVLGLKKNAAMRLVSKMMGGMEVTELDDMAKSGLGEVLNMIAGTTFSKIQTGGQLTNLSPPTLVTGKNVFLMISRVQSNRLEFQLEDDTFTLSYCVE